MVQRAAPLLALGRYARQMLSHRPRLFAATLALNVANGMLEGVSLFLLVPLLGFLGVGGSAGLQSLALPDVIQRVLGTIVAAAGFEVVLGLFLLLILLRGILNWLLAQSGARLTSAAQVLQQDRANFHRFGNGDYDDQYDSYFTSVSRRQMMSNMVDRGGMGSAARSAIVNNNVLVWVEIWQGGSGPYVLVSILP